MIVLSGRNVNSLFPQGIALLREQGSIEQTSAGLALVLDRPVCSIYSHPQERVLFHPSRDANPFFHLFEALWMLAGRRDAHWLDQFVGDFSQRFAEPDGTLHGAYGFRWRQHFDIEGGGEYQPLGPGWLPDQLDGIVRLLGRDPLSRRAVLTMWDPVSDLGANKRDLPCNTHAYFRVREASPNLQAVQHRHRRVLDLTICCRSNDAIWGAYGANAVHFSILQEYVAQRIGVGIGRMYQISNNFHAYTEILDKIDLTPTPDPYSEGLVEPIPIVTVPDAFDTDNYTFLTEQGTYFQNLFFDHTAARMLEAHRAWKRKNYIAAYEAIERPVRSLDSDWRLAAYRWFARRQRPTVPAKEHTDAS